MTENETSPHVLHDVHGRTEGRRPNEDGRPTYIFGVVLHTLSCPTRSLPRSLVPHPAAATAVANVMRQAQCTGSGIGMKTEEGGARWHGITRAAGQNREIV